ncbi:MAG: hypothetical protein FIB08_07255 [Candidatus Methanoperedens sp.]|nr:hypothetical protein [Candidatus Methanoperedens sp.]
MLNEEDEEKELEGYCQDCGEYMYTGLTKCPESGEEVKDNCWLEHTFCRDCCIIALENGDCEGSCEESFVDKYRKSRKR